MTHPTAATAPDDDAPPRLSPLGFWVSLGLCLAIFVALNPFWEPLDMDQVNDNIVWSYAPIPLLVAGFLALERKLGWLAFVLEAIKLTFVKFAVTFLAANIAWGFIGPPPLPDTGDGTTGPASAPTGRETPGKDDFFVREPPPPTPLEPAALGEVSGTVRDAAGRPLTGALVWVASGLEATVFAPPPGALELRNQAGWSAPLPVVQAHQLVRLHADARQLHTAQLQDRDGRPLFNYPLAPGSTRELMFKRGLGALRLSCKVHGADEPALALIVTDNPFWALTDADGRFAFTGVPAGELRVAALPPGGGDPTTSSVTPTPGGTEQLQITLR